jgi:hypothetical protein
MAFLGVVADLAAESGAEFGVDYARAMLPSIIGAGLNEGYSGAEMLRQLQSVGLGIRTQTFYQILGNVQASAVTAGLNLGASLTALPDASEIAPWLTQNASGYLYQARFLAQTVDPDTGAIITSWNDFSMRYTSVQSRGEVLQDIIDVLNQGQADAAAGADTPPQQSILGVEVTNIYQMTPG